MLGIVLYCVGVMYTPGPVNILSLNRGMAYRFTSHIPFCIGVGISLFFWFALIGYTGSAVIDEKALPVISTLGVCFILYLAWKVVTSDIDAPSNGVGNSVLGFRSGLLMQLLNPKAFLVVLPVTAVQFPACGIEGNEIVLWSAGLGALGFGAPFLYAVVGSNLSRYIEKTSCLRWFNVIMGIMLIAVALDMAYTQIYQPLLTNPY